MARRQKATATAPRRGPERDTTARSRKAAPAAVAAVDVEVVEEERGLGIDEGILIITTLCFLGAVLVTDYVLGRFYGAGWFFN